MGTTNDKRLAKSPSIRRATSADRRKNDSEPSVANAGGMQGEGNYEAARAFNDAEHGFVAAGKVAPAARAAAPKSDAEQEEMIAAELAGKRRARE